MVNEFKRESDCPGEIGDMILCYHQGWREHEAIVVAIKISPTRAKVEWIWGTEQEQRDYVLTEGELNVGPNSAWDDIVVVGK